LIWAFRRLLARLSGRLAAPCVLSASYSLLLAYFCSHPVEGAYLDLSVPMIVFLGVCFFLVAGPLVPSLSRILRVVVLIQPLISGARPP